MYDPTPETIPLRGGRLCLDFANTVDWHADATHVDADRTDVLTSPDALIRWGRRLELLSPRAGAATRLVARSVKLFRTPVAHKPL